MFPNVSLCLCMYVCVCTECRCATSNPSAEEMHSKIENAHVILVSGGNTLYATDRWTALGLRDIFRSAMERGTVMTGGSAGAICWYRFIYIPTSDFQHHAMFLCYQSSYCDFNLFPNHCVFVLDMTCCATIASYRFDAGHSDSMDPDSYLRQQSCDGALCRLFFFLHLRSVNCLSSISFFSRRRACPN